MMIPMPLPEAEWNDTARLEHAVEVLLTPGTPRKLAFLAEALAGKLPKLSHTIAGNKRRAAWWAKQRKVGRALRKLQDQGRAYFHTGKGAGWVPVPKVVSEGLDTDGFDGHDYSAKDAEPAIILIHCGDQAKVETVTVGTDWRDLQPNVVPSDEPTVSPWHDPATNDPEDPTP